MNNITMNIKEREQLKMFKLIEEGAISKTEAAARLRCSTRWVVEEHGLPELFYTDHGSVFHVNLHNPENDKKTQWEMACAELGIKVQHAHSPQAKGRVERCNKTMQDRLAKEMRLANISSIELANRYLQEGDFIASHNQRFAIKAAQKGNAHSDAKKHLLSDVFTIKENRIIANDYTIVFQKRIFQLHFKQNRIVRPKDEITVKLSLDGTIKLWIRKTELGYSEIKSRPTKQQETKVIKSQLRKVHENSRRWANGLPPLTRNEASPAGCRGETR